jgi:hypothetical protein
VRIFVQSAQNKALSFDTIDKIRLVNLLKREKKFPKSAKNLCQTGKKWWLIRQNHQKQAAKIAIMHKNYKVLSAAAAAAASVFF